MRKADTVEAKRKATGDRGLAWGAGNFKGGILTLSKKDVQKETTHLNTKITLGGDRLAGGGTRKKVKGGKKGNCLLYTSPSPRDATLSRMPSSA